MSRSVVPVKALRRQQASLPLARHMLWSPIQFTINIQNIRRTCLLVPSPCWDLLSKKIFADNPPNFSFQFQQRSQGFEAIVGTSYMEEGVRCCLNWRTLTWRGDFARGGAKADNLFWNWKEERLYLWSTEAAGWELSLEVAKWGQNDSNVPRPGLSSRGLK